MFVHKIQYIRNVTFFPLKAKYLLQAPVSLGSGHLPAINSVGAPTISPQHSPFPYLPTVSYC